MTSLVRTIESSDLLLGGSLNGVLRRSEIARRRRDEQPDLTMTDVLAPFQRLILVMRWAVLVVATGLVVANTVTGRREAPILGFVALWTAARSWRPIRFEGRAGITTLAIGVELLIAVAAVVSTGRWDSPFVFCLLPGVANLDTCGPVGATCSTSARRDACNPHCSARGCFAFGHFRRRLRTSG